LANRNRNPNPNPNPNRKPNPNRNPNRNRNRNPNPNPNQADGPDRAFVTIPQCASGPEASCPLERFRQLVLSSIKAECVSTVPVDAL